MTPFEASKHPEINQIVPYELAIHERTNEAREQRGIATVAFDTQIAYISRKYSQTMALNNEYGHGIAGKSLVERLWGYGSDCSSAGENIFFGKIKEENIKSYSPEISSESIITNWLNSDEGHRENLLNDEWEYEGVGVYVTADAKVYVTQTFTARECDGPGDPPRYDGEYDG